MAISKIRKGDEIVVIAGKDKGRNGTVLKVLADERLLVENINVAKKHQKPNPNAGVGGGIIEKEAPLHISNVAHVDPKGALPTRVGTRVLDDGRKVRYAKRSGEVIDA